MRVHISILLRRLIASIHSLPSHKMEKVIEIIQSAISHTGVGEDDVEVPLDDLDTFTLRKLQKFVEDDIAEKRKHIYTPQNVVINPHGHKKTRKDPANNLKPVKPVKTSETPMKPMNPVKPMKPMKLMKPMKPTKHMKTTETHKFNEHR